ncbi:pseudouridine-metabolizing bifunctional protein [Apis cerana cerana]|uniref:Pseudouridine-metabolizing bifunctional protein n=1 Tax=Apis cerana cerana TaxID=94128 RepID=A0A2A3EEY1_APICC|nr:pseudouridine-metabolizing bifunctional protein [Apis cerana cerana]
MEAGGRCAATGHWLFLTEIISVAASIESFVNQLEKKYTYGIEKNNIDKKPGKAIIKSLGDGGQTVEQLSNMNTARCTTIIDYKGECRFGIGEMEVFTSISPNLVKKYQSYVENSSIIVLDGNLPLDTIQYLLELATYSKIPDY